MRTITHIIGKVITEKATNLESSLIYAFEVDISSSKTQIKEAMKALYGELPQSVRVITRKSQPRRAGKTRRVLVGQPKKIAYVHMKNALKGISNTK